VFQISILLAQWFPGCAISKIFYKLSDGLIMLHFILDPLFYVLLRLFPNILKVVFRICQPHQSGPTSLAITDNEISPTVDDQTTPAAAKIITVPNI
jgi:hypothetical protein